ncbi:uncharacterized protein LOC125264085 [Megalobrama amblycephala]|uniref:uncharacterized protein LOC125264085 n=1 Tax=Megalobrama amblycephala TaxID=75352 RepID=UPI00201464E2|nr:uncharacterized protein LOC125264085 [Megalobrama amblycephala]
MDGTNATVAEPVYRDVLHQLFLCFFDNDTDGVPAFVKQGDSITLHTGVEANQQDRIIWYFYDTLIAEITGDISYVCIDIRCEDGTERFRDRLNLDNQTGSLTITNITYTDAGVYQQVIISSNSSSSEKNFIVSVYGVQQFVYGLDIRSSGTLDPGVIKKPNDVMTWYFRDILIAEIIGDQSKICTEERCKQIFRDRLEVNHQTGSLTITNTKTKDFGIFNLLISSNNFSIMKTFHVILFGTRVFLEDEYLYVFENDQVTLHTNVETNQQEVIQWYFSGIHIAEISGDLSFICTDVQCNNGTERFRDRLELDHQTGSLTIPYIGDTDHGVYHLQIICSSGIRTTKKFLVLLTHSACAPNEEVPVLVMVKDSVTLHTDAKTYEYEKIVWCFNDIRIAVITGDLRYNCTDVQCNKGTERFRDRLKLDHQTGSLTITNIMTSDAGYYDLYFESGCSSRVFMVFLSGGFAAELVTVQSVKEGESVTLDPGELKIPYDLMTWYFNDILIAKISRDHKISTDEQCEDGNEGLRERLQLDHQTGSLTIMNTKNTDSGLYKLQITHRDKSISISSFRSFGVNVTAIPDSGLSTAVVAGASAAAAAVVLLITAAAGVIYRHKHQAKMNDIRTQSNDQADGAEDLSPTQFNLLLSDTTRTCLNQPETPTETPM